MLKRLSALAKPPGAEKLEASIRRLLPERSLLEILCNVEHWLNWTRHFGPVSGLAEKQGEDQERYLLIIFGYGCNLGSNQTARIPEGEYRAMNYSISIASTSLPRCWRQPPEISSTAIIASTSSVAILRL